MVWSSIPDVVEVEILRGAEADPAAPPDLLVELPHGATRTHHYTHARAALQSPLPPDLDHFFFVNTDVGSPELGRAAAQQLLARRPESTAILLCAQVPRTFIDFNRVIALSTGLHDPHGITPGLPPYITAPADRARLLQQHAAYQALVDAVFAQVQAAGGVALMMHTYAPRAVDVAVDDRIVASLHDAYRPENVERWPLRSEVDIICRDMDGNLVGSAELIDDVVARYAAIGVQATRSATYPLHPATAAAQRALQAPSHALCVEVRRDLVVEPFTPFQEMLPDPTRVERLAGPLAEALAAWLDYHAMHPHPHSSM